MSIMHELQAYSCAPVHVESTCQDKHEPVLRYRCENVFVNPLSLCLPLDKMLNKVAYYSPELSNWSGTRVSEGQSLPT